MDDLAWDGFRRRPGWAIFLIALLIGQAWLTWDFFGADSSFRVFTDARPVVSGQHPLHFYHGQFGARQWLEHGSSCGYDPNFQAGYPKTPVFDEGCRLAELFLLVVKGDDSAHAYKIGLALTCLFAPIAIVLAGRGIGLSPSTCCLSGLFGIVLWWSEPCRGLILQGDVDLLLGGMCATVHLAWLGRFARMPGLDSWTMLTFSGLLGWYLEPLLWLLISPLVLSYYLWIAWRQELTWHLAWLGSSVIALLVNIPWIGDWLRFFWMRVPQGSESAESWWRGFSVPGVPAGGSADLSAWVSAQPLVTLLLLSAVIGNLLYAFRRSGGSAILLLSAAVGAGMLAYATGANTLPQGWKSIHFGMIVLWCAIPFSAHLIVALAKVPRPAVAYRLYRAGGGIILCAALAGFCWLSFQRPTTSLEFGLSSAQTLVVQELRAKTTPDARILWEEQTDQEKAGWEVLLPILTDRFFLGGLGSVDLEHGFATLRDGVLAGRALTDWSDEELSRFCDRYNVGWVVARTPQSQRRWSTFARAHEVTTWSAQDQGILFVIDEPRGYVLQGSAIWVEASHRRIALKEVRPNADGKVVLSLHYQQGLHVSPEYVRLERAIDPFDPIPFIRLHAPGPVPRVTITWDDR